MSHPPTVDPLFLELQTAVAGRYSLERELGRGGMGIVYLARDVSLDRPVALKLLPPELAARAAFRERFLREARTAARLSHPNIVPIHAVEESGRLVWFVMAYVAGESLGQRIRERGPVSAGEAARVLRDVAWALGHAHAQGVVHRDVKPDNILLEAGGRRALVADFGIAAPLRGEAEEAGAVVGTIGYLSPEQARGDPVDGRTDIYSLGVVGYYIVSGRLPYQAVSLTELVARHLAGTPAPLAAAAPHAPRALTRVIDRCLAGYPSARFQTGEELADILDQLGQTSSDLPAPFRVWIAKGNERRSPLLLFSVIWAGPALIGGLVTMFAAGGSGLATMLIGGVMLSVPWGLFGLNRAMQTRKLLAAGYTHADIITALQQHLERRREELAFEFNDKPTRLGVALRWTFFGSIGLGFLTLFAGAVLHGSAQAATLSGALVLFCTALATGLLGRIFPGRKTPPTDHFARFALRFWRSGFGRWVTRIAGWGLKHRAPPEQALHRPTEVALGEAAEALFKALPAEQRRDLARLPEQLGYLSQQAQHMRRRLEELDDLILQATPDTLFGERGESRSDGGAAELREARDLWAARLQETMTLMESLRVGLLKLHAGSAVPEQLTADLDAARELKQRLSLLAEGQAEADQVLSPPRTGP